MQRINLSLGYAVVKYVMKATPHIITDMLQCCLPSGAARLSPLHYVLCLQAVEIKGSVLMPKLTWQPGHQQGQWHSHALPGHLPSRFIGSKKSLPERSRRTDLTQGLFIYSFIFFPCRKTAFLAEQQASHIEIEHPESPASLHPWKMPVPIF